MGFLTGLIIGVGIGIIIVPLAIWSIYKYFDTKVRRNIKTLLEQGKFLKPIDTRDFDVEMWKDKVDLNECNTYMKNLNDKVYHIGKFKDPDEDDIPETSKNDLNK